jgi:putative two-component system response regulator
MEHPAIGASLVEHLPAAGAVAAAVATHHEWFDGWGKPRGLSGDAIPRAGMVLAAAEFIVEMTSPRSVARAWPVERVLRELEQRRGSQFAPDVADAASRAVAGLDEVGA